MNFRLSTQPQKFETIMATIGYKNGSYCAGPPRELSIVALAKRIAALGMRICWGKIKHYENVSM